MADISEIKAKYPQYEDMSDEEFADKFHAKYYSDMPREEFDKKLGVKSSDSILSSVGKYLGGQFDSTLAETSGMASGMGGGIAYLGSKLLGGTNDTAQQAKQSVEDAYTWQPRTEQGKKGVQAFGDTMNAAKTGIRAVTDPILENQQKTEDIYQKAKDPTFMPGANMLDKIAALQKSEGNPDNRVAPEVKDALADALLTVAPVHEVGNLAKSVFTREPRAIAPPRVEPTMAPPVDHPIPEFQGPPEPPERPLPSLDMSEVSPVAPEAPVQAPEALPELHDPSPTGKLPEGPQAPPELSLVGKDDPLPPPRGEDAPLPEIPKPDNPLLDLQDKPVGTPNANTPLPTIDFPDRFSSFDSDPWIQQAGERVQELAGKVTPEARAETKALTEHAIEYAKDKYGIDENTARQKLYETGSETHAPIQKTYDGSRGLGMRKQGGSADINLMTLGIGKLIDRFKKKGETPEGTTPVTKAQAEVVPKQLREHFKPINNADDVLTAVIKNNEKDIPASSSDRLNDARRSFGSGVRIHAERTGNSILQFVNTKLFDHGEAPAKAAINKYINAKNGVGPLLKKLTPEEKLKGMQALKMENKDNKRYSRDQLKEMGYNDKIADVLDAVHTMHDHQFEVNGKGDYRTGYMPQSYRGDYKAIVRDPETGKTLQVLNAKNAAEMKLARESATKEFPNGVISETSRTPVRSERSWNRGVSTIQDIMDIYKDKGELSHEAMQNLINERDITSTRNLFGGNVHDLNRASYDIRGWDGDKPWLSDKENADEGWKSLIATSEQQYFHHYLQDPVNEIKKVLSNPEIMSRQPNAVQAAQAYVRDKVGSNDIWSTGRGINGVVDTVADVFGKGGSAPTHLKDGVRKFTHLWQLGINIKNFAVQLTQPVVSGLPYLKLMQKAEGMGATEVARGTSLGIARYIRSLTETNLSKTDQFTKDMTQYATDNGMRSFAETENAMDAANSRFVRAIDKFGNALPGFAEQTTRAPMFSVFASMLKEAWDRDPTKFASQEELFQTAKNYTQTVMVDYSQNPSGYRKLFGVGGSLAGQFKTYGFATTGALRLLWKHDKVAFASAVGMLTYVTGINGLPMYQDLNNLVKDASGIFGDKLVDIEDLYKQHFPEIAKLTGLTSDTLFHGGLSKHLGVNVEQQFGFSNTIPAVDFNSETSPGMQIAQNITPSMQGVATPLINSAKAIASPSNMNDMAAIKSILPPQLRGPFVNRMLTKPDGNVINPDTGQYQAHTRTPTEQMMANFNLTSNQEVRDKETKFKADEQGHFLQIQEKKAVQDIVSKTMGGDLQPSDIDKAVKTYIKSGGDPNSFISSYITKLQAAQTEGIARGAGIPNNSLASINRYLRYHPELIQGQQ